MMQNILSADVGTLSDLPPILDYAPWLLATVLGGAVVAWCVVQLVRNWVWRNS